MKLLRRHTWADVAPRPPPFIVAIFGMCVLLLIEWLLETRLNTTMNGAHFAAADGRMAEAVVRTGYQFAAFPDLTNLNPLQGLGSQLLPMNVGSILSIGLLPFSTANWLQILQGWWL